MQDAGLKKSEEAAGAVVLEGGVRRELAAVTSVWLGGREGACIGTGRMRGSVGGEAMTPVQRALLQTPGMMSAPGTTTAAVAEGGEGVGHLRTTTGVDSGRRVTRSMAGRGVGGILSSGGSRSSKLGRAGESHGVHSRIQRALGRLQPAPLTAQSPLGMYKTPSAGEMGPYGGGHGHGGGYSFGVGGRAGVLENEGEEEETGGEAELARRVLEVEQEAQFWSRLAKEEQNECERVRGVLEGEVEVWKAKAESSERQVAEGRAEREALRAEVAEGRREEQAHGARRLEMAQEHWEKMAGEREREAERRGGERGRERVSEVEKEVDKLREEVDKLREEVLALGEAKDEAEAGLKEARAEVEEARARVEGRAEEMRAEKDRAVRAEAELAGARAWQRKVTEAMEVAGMPVPWDDAAAGAAREADAAQKEAIAKALETGAREEVGGQVEAWAPPTSDVDTAEVHLLRQALSEVKGEYSKLKAWHESVVLDHAEQEAAWGEREKRLQVSLASAKADTESARNGRVEQAEAAGRWEAEAESLKSALEAAEFSLAQAKQAAGLEAEKLAAFQVGAERRSEEARRGAEELVEKLVGAESRVAAVQLALEDERGARRRDAQVASLREKELEHALALARERKGEATTTEMAGSDKAGELWERLKECELEREGLRTSLQEARLEAVGERAEAGHRLDTAVREAESLRERLLAVKESGDGREGQLRGEVTRLHSELAEARAIAEKCREEVVELEDALERAREDGENRMRAMRGDEDGMQVELEHARREAKDAKERLAAAVASHDVLTGKLRAEVEHLEAKAQEANGASDEAQQALLEERTRAELAERRVATAEKRSASMEEQIAELRQSARAHGDIVRELELEREQSRRDVSRLEDKVGEMEVELRHKEVTGYNVEQLLSERVSAVSKVSKRSTDEVEAHAQLQVTLRALEFERDDLRREWQGEKADHARTRGRVEKLLGELAEVRKELAEVPRAGAEVQDKMDGLTEERAQLQSLVRALEFERDDLKRELQGERAEHVRTRGRTDKARAEVVEFREALARAEVELRRSLEVEAEAQLQVKGLTRELSVIEAAGNSAHDQRHELLKGENERLRGRLGVLEVQLHEALGEASTAMRQFETSLEEGELVRERFELQKDLHERAVADLRRMNKHLRTELEAAQKSVAEAVSANEANVDELLQSRGLGQALLAEVNLLRGDLSERGTREGARSPGAASLSPGENRGAVEGHEDEDLVEMRRATMSPVVNQDWLMQDLALATESASKLNLEDERDLRQELDEARTAIEDLKAQLEEAKGHHVLHGAKGDHAHPERDHGAAGVHHDAVHSLGEALAREKVEKQGLAEELNTARRLADDLGARLSAMEEKHAEAVEEKDRKIAELNTARTRTDELEREVKGLLVLQEHASRALSAKEANDADAVAHQLRFDVARLQEALAAEKRQVDSLGRELPDARDKLQREKEAGEKVARELSDARDKLQREKEAGEKIARELSDARDKLQREKEAGEKIARELSDARDKLQREKETGEKARELAAEVERKHAQERREFSEVRDKLEVRGKEGERERAAADYELSTARSEVARLNLKVGTLKAGKVAMQADLSNIKSEVQETMATLKSTLNEMESLRSSLAKVEAEKKEVVMELAETKGLLSAERKGSSGQADRERELERLLAEAKEETAAQFKWLNNAEDEHRVALETVRKEYEAFIEDAHAAADANLRSTQEALEGEIAELREQLEREKKAGENAAMELVAEAERRYKEDAEETVRQEVEAHTREIEEVTRGVEEIKKQLMQEAEEKVKAEVAGMKQVHAEELEAAKASVGGSKEELVQEAEERVRLEIAGIKRGHAEELKAAKARWEADKEKYRREAEERLRRTLDEQERGHAQALERAERAAEIKIKGLGVDKAQMEELNKRHSAELAKAESAWHETRDHMRKDAAEALNKVELAHREVLRRADDAHHKAMQREEQNHAATRASLGRAEAEAEGLRTQLHKALDEARQHKHQKDAHAAQVEQERKSHLLNKEVVEGHAREAKAMKFKVEHLEMEVEALSGKVKAKQDRCEELEARVASLEVDLRESEATVGRQKVQLAAVEYKHEDLRERAKVDFTFLQGVSEGLEDRMRGCLSRLRSIEGMGDIGGSRERAVAREVACKALRSAVERFLEDFKQTWKQVTNPGNGSLETLSQQQAQVGRTLAHVGERVSEAEAALAELLIEYSVGTPAGGSRHRSRFGTAGLSDEHVEHAEHHEEYYYGEHHSDHHGGHALEASHGALMDEAAMLRRELESSLREAGGGTPYHDMATPGDAVPPTPASRASGLRNMASKAYADREALLRELESGSPYSVATPNPGHWTPSTARPAPTPATRYRKPGDEFRGM